MGRLRCFQALASARRDSLARLRRPGIRRLLVVCHGNIYRSAFVGAYIVRQAIPGLQIRSSGLHPVVGRPAPARHVEMSQRFGVDLSAHRSSIVAPTDLVWAELIVVMDRHNWQALVERGAATERLVWLGALDGGAIEIVDPYGLDDIHAERVVARLAACSERLATRVRQ